MPQIKLYVTMQVSPEFFDEYSDNKEYIAEELQIIAEAFDGDVVDLEVK